MKSGRFAQAVRRLIHWASRHASDMEGVGTTWIEKLAEDGVLRRRSDFYELSADTDDGALDLGTQRWAVRHA